MATEDVEVAGKHRDGLVGLTVVVPKPPVFTCSGGGGLLFIFTLSTFRLLLHPFSSTPTDNGDGYNVTCFFANTTPTRIHTRKHGPVSFSVVTSFYRRSLPDEDRRMLDRNLIICK